MATVYSRKCNICGKKALRRDSYIVSPASSTKEILVCEKCGKPVGAFLKKNGLLKTIHPKTVGSQSRILKTKRAR